MYCTKDCSCSLCRELGGYKPPKSPKKAQSRPPHTSTSILGRLNENFILRRRSSSSIKTFQPQSLKCSEMCQQRDMGEIYDFCQRRTSTPSPTPVTQAPAAATLLGNEPAAAAAGKEHETPLKPNHKVVIYFGDSLVYRAKGSPNETGALALQLNTGQPKRIESTATNSELPSYVESVQNGVINIRIEGNYQHATELVQKVSKAPHALVGKPKDVASSNDEEVSDDDDDDGDDGDDVGGGGEDVAAEELHPSGEDEAHGQTDDWSFVQEWRARPIGNVRSTEGAGLHGNTAFSYATALPAQLNSVGLQQASSANSGRIQSPAVATPAPRAPKEVAQRPTALTSSQCLINVVPIGANTRDTTFHNGATKPGVFLAPSCSGMGNKSVAQRAMAGPARLTVQSTPVKAQPPMLSGSLGQQLNTSAEKGSDKMPLNFSPAAIGIPIEAAYQHGQHVTSKTSHSTRTHHHELRTLERVQECHSSSDENRSSGHASMSDTGGNGSSSPGGVVLGPLPEDRFSAAVTNRSTRARATTNHARARHRATPAKAPWSGSGLEDIKMAIQQLTIRSQTSTSTYSSVSAGSESSEPARRLGRYGSLETVNTNVTNADEFVWVDSHNRLVELQHFPWSQHCILKVLRDGRCKEHVDRVAPDALSRLGYLLQRALVRIAREIQRLSSNLGLCSKQEVAGALKIVLCPALSDSCIKACLRAAAMFAVPGDSALKQSKSSRAGLQLSVGRFHRWMTDSRLGKFIHEYAAVYLCAGVENLMEEILLQCFAADSNQQLTAAALEHTISQSGDIWGLLQPFAHLNAGRIASGALTMPRWANHSSLGTGTHQSGPSAGVPVAGGLEPCLLTTCVGSVAELRELTLRAQKKFQHCVISNAALTTLFYFMRCSQLEHSDFSTQASAAGNANSNSQSNSSQNIQELCYERAYVVLPPLVEWLRVASAHAEYRSAVLIDKDDIMQAARLLLPGVDCPMRPVAHDEELPTKKSSYLPHITPSPSMPSSISDDTSELGKRATISLAFKLMLTGRAELVSQASNLLPPTTRYDTLNHAGMTALMIASIRNDEVVLQALLDAGCDPNIEVPAIGNPSYPAIQPDTQHWTAVTFAASKANYAALRLLLERGGKVEGGARQSEDKHTLTPLQVACGSGHTEIVSLLLVHGANAFLSTQQKDSMSFAGSAQRGCYCAISVAAAHGQRAILRKLMSTPVAQGSKDVLSLEEMLAEGDSPSARPVTVADRLASNEISNTMSKTQIKSLQEAMYHSAENNHLDITIELRTMGVPWTLHCWMHALAAAHELRLDGVIDQLLQDFLQVCPDDYSVQFVSECLPLLFNIFRYSKNEGTTLLLADIFATCYGWQQIKSIQEPSAQPVNSSRIDPKFVNNPELSDVTFRVEGKVFYGHKIVLVTASPRFQNMLSSKLSESSTPTVQINDIRYHIFQLVMQYLYSGGCSSLDVVKADVLELMAAASFFQLDGLLHYTESRCSEMIDIDNVVAMYIHAKVYDANKLLEFCQGFLLQNMVALLTYDDSVKRLLFAKKIPNHDVLNGLLQALQQRIKERKSLGSCSFRQHLSSPSAAAAATAAANATGGGSK